MKFNVLNIFKILLFSLFIILLVGIVSAEVEVIRNPYLQNVTANSILIAWKTDCLANSTIEYGTTLSYGYEVNSSNLETKHAVTINGLSENTKYYYRVLLNDTVFFEGDDYYFITSKSSGDTKFFIVGDHSLSQNFNTIISTRNYDFGLHVGDLIQASDDTYDVDYFSQDYIYGIYGYQDIIRNKVIFPIIGNHDISDCGSTPGSIYGENCYIDVFYLPSNNPDNSEEYYSFDYGDVHITVMNWADLGNTTFLTWLENDLATTDKKWKITLTHEPFYPCGSHNASHAVDTIEPILNQYGVDIQFNGHNHHYSRTYPIYQDVIFNQSSEPNYINPNATIHITNGASRSSANPTSVCDYVANGNDTQALYGEIIISGDVLTYNVIKTDDTIFDSMTVTKHNNQANSNYSPADTDNSGSIDLTELSSYIQLWKSTSSISLSQLISAINDWKTESNTDSCEPITCGANDCGIINDGCSGTINCGVCVSCGDGSCNGDETCSSCVTDCGACSNDININVDVSDFSGVAPLSVFFDTATTTATTTNKPVHELDYSWDFGVGSESDVSSGGRYFKGFNAAHVFETPGTYTVGLTVKDIDGNTAQENFQIEVLSEPTGGWNTYCFSNDDDFTGCPSGSTEIETTYWSGDSGIDVLDYVGENNRLLLKKGDTFYYSVSDVIDSPSMFISAFGTGDNPIVQFVGTRVNSWEQPAFTYGGNEVMVSDINFELYDEGSHGAFGGNPKLLLRIFSNGVVHFGETFLVDSNLTHLAGNPGYSNGKYNVILNNDFGPSRSHGIYGECQNRSIFSGNYFHDVDMSNLGRTGIRLAANTCFSDNILVSNNIFENIPAHAIQIELTTHNTERFIESNVVIEKNKFINCGGVLIGREHGHRNITIRNNIFSVSSISSAIALENSVSYHPEWARGVEGLWVYNNVFYHNNPLDEGWRQVVNLGHNDSKDVSFKNNIFMGDPTSTVTSFRPLSINFASLDELIFENNIYYYSNILDTGGMIRGAESGYPTFAEWQALGFDSESIIANPLFVDSPNSNFRLQSNSPAIDAGVQVIIFDDFGGDLRNLNSIDIGPFEYIN